jgi:ABC-2 type transport system permease protein
MTRLVHAELFRLRTTRTTWALLAGAIALTALVLFPALSGAGSGSFPSLGTPHSLETIVAAPRFVSYFSMLLGVLAVAGEYRHRTITTTFLATPDRSRVVLAKLGALGLAGLGFGALGNVIALGAAVLWHQARGVPLQLLQPDVGTSVLGLVLVASLFAMLGVGVGALVPNQTAAMVGVIVWLQIVELSVLAGISPGLFKWTATGAALALAGLEPPSPSLSVLSPLPGGLLLAAYALVLAGVASRLTLQRDVT